MVGAAVAATVLLLLAMRSLLAQPKDSGVESTLWAPLEACMAATKQALWQPQLPQPPRQQLAADGGPSLLGQQGQEEGQEEQEQGAVQQHTGLASQRPEERPVSSSSPGLASQPVSSSCSMPRSAAPGAASNGFPATADYKGTGSTPAAAAIEPTPTLPPPAPTGLMLMLTALLYGSAAAAAGVWLALLRCKRRLARLQRQAEGAQAAVGAASQLQLDAAAGGLLPASPLASPPRWQIPSADGVAVVAVTGGAAAAKAGEHRLAARRSLRFPSLQRPSAHGAKHKVSSSCHLN
jgi:hypothetical protein